MFCRWHRSFPPLESLKTVVVFKNKAKLYTKWDKKNKKKSQSASWDNLPIKMIHSQEPPGRPSHLQHLLRGLLRGLWIPSQCSVVRFTDRLSPKRRRRLQIYWLAFNALFTLTRLPFIYFIQSPGYYFVAHICIFLFSVVQKCLLNEVGTDTEQISLFLYKMRLYTYNHTGILM